MTAFADGESAASVRAKINATIVGFEAIRTGTLIVTVGQMKPEHVETVVVAGVVATNRIFLALGVHLDSDENDPELLDILALSGAAGTATITVTMAFAAPTTGPIKLNWMAI